MPPRNEAALDFLLTRRSRPAKTLTTPVPDRPALEQLLTAAARTPDHGKLEPWRFVVLERTVLQRLAEVVPARHAALGLPEEQLEKGLAQFRDGGLAVAVIESPVMSDKIPAIEQSYSAGAACLALLNAALASGWGANWLTGWPVHDRTFVETHLGLAPAERVAGLVHIGTETSAPPERPRPDLGRKVTFLE
ncbi:nitroreductase family protein [Salibaculum halophilum]|uniref:nitroreductase family protein n=1 Tax=Salibaculum halophilum TaxID=1914408 RepID=UPI000A11B010|nr:nitroreductase family protein [Salibaculum halophilum]